MGTVPASPGTVYRRPLLLPSIALALGVAVGIGDPGLEVGFLGLVVGCAALAAATPFRLAAVAAWACLGAAAAAGIAPAGPGEHALDPYLGGDPILITGTVREPPRRSPDGFWQAVVDLQTPATGTVRLRGKGGPPPPAGASVSARARLRPPRTHAVPGQGDRAASDARRGIRANAYPSPAQAVLFARGRESPAQKFRGAARRFLARRLDSPVRGLALALVLGDRAELEPELTESFRRTGTSHLLAISGLHVGVVGLVLGLLARWTGARIRWLRIRLSPRVFGLWVGVLGAISYGSITGWAVSTRRATAMALALALVLATRRRPEPVQICAVAWCALLWADPSALWEPATWLSFGSVLSIVRLCPRSRRHPALGFLVASSAAALGTLPWALACFGQASLTSVPANAVAIPLLGAILVPLLLASVVTGLLLPPFGTFLLAAADVVARAGCAILSWAGDPGWSPQLLGSPPPGQTAASLLVLGAALALPRLRHRWLGAGLAAAVTLIPVHPGHPPRGALTLTVLAVGHGDALLLSLPDGGHLLVDGGGAQGTYDPGEALVVPALRRMGIRSLEAVVISHLHVDHYGGILAVLGEVDVGELWLPVVPPPGHPALDLLAAARHGNIPIRILAAGRPPPSELGGCRLQWLHPRDGRPWPRGSRGRGANDHSVVLRASHGERAMLLTGDAEAPLEADLVATHGDLRADVLKVPHHGSNTSSSPPLLAAVAPRLAVVSVDPTSSHHLPRPSVLGRYRGRGTALLATGRDGTIQVTTDGSELRVRTFRPPTGWQPWEVLPDAGAGRSPPRRR